MADENTTAVAMDGRHHDETWEEHKKHFHHGKEPTGRCEWREEHGMGGGKPSSISGSREYVDSRGKKWVIPEVKPRKPSRFPYGTEWFYRPDASLSRGGSSRRPTSPGRGTRDIGREDLLSRDFFGGYGYGGKKKDRRPLDERIAEVKDEVRKPCDELFSDLASKGISVSSELKKYSLALMCGLDVDESKIKDIPEVKAASAKYDEFAAKRKAEHLPETTGYDYSGKRTALRAEILEKFRKPIVDKSTNMELDDGESYEVEKGKRFDIVTGMPAAGKSSTFVRPLSLKYHSRLCDPDQIKTFIPEYSDGLGAGIVHNESKVLCRDVMYYAMDNGENIIFPTLGGAGNMGRLIRIAEDAHSRGYEVHMHFNDIDRNKAIGRMLYRLAQTGRFIPLHYFDDSFNLPYEKCGKYCDSQEKVEQGAGKGVEPKKVDFKKHSLPKGKFKPTDEARTSYFYAEERMPKTPPPKKEKPAPSARKGEEKSEPIPLFELEDTMGGTDDGDSGKTPDEILYDWYV
jgi:predicted ABC-type ATPase